MLAAVALLVAAAPSLAADTLAPCSAAENATLEAILAPVANLVTTCKTDTGYTIFPFTSFPTDEQQRFVCNGRSCPTVFNQFQDAKLPQCTLLIDGAQMTPDAFLKKLCEVRVATPTPTTPTPTTTKPVPGATTASPTPSTAPTTAPTSTSTPTPTTSATPSATTTPAPSPTAAASGEGDASEGSTAGSTTKPIDIGSSDSSASKPTVSTPAPARTTAPASTSSAAVQVLSASVAMAAALSLVL